MKRWLACGVLAGSLVGSLVGTAAIAQDEQFPPAARPAGADYNPFPPATDLPHRQPQTSQDFDQRRVARELIFRRAVKKGDERQARLAAMQWIGYSPSRPATAPWMPMSSSDWYPFSYPRVPMMPYPGW